VVLTDEEFERLKPEDKEFCDYFEKNKEALLNIAGLRANNLPDIYDGIIKILKRYCDLEEKYYSIIALWIIGTYMHSQFPAYPYLFFNASKGSGKSRLLRLISYLSKDGRMLNSLTEAVLFRTKGMLAIDEFEVVNWKGKENLVELLNSAYKKGTKVCRMRKVKSMLGEGQEVEEFDVYRPICMANISGVDIVLGDRCLTIYLNKSNKASVVKRMEIFDLDDKITQLLSTIHEFPFESVVYSDTFKQWGCYVDVLDEAYTLSTHTTQTTHTTLFQKINNSNINGRNLELTMPLLILADMISEEVFDLTLKICIEIVEDKKKEDNVESIDNSVLSFVSQEVQTNQFISVRELFDRFKEFYKSDALWLNDKWFGKALKRLVLVKDKKRLNSGIFVVLDVDMACKKCLL
jgi:hypothetical protein